MAKKQIDKAAALAYHGHWSAETKKMVQGHITRLKAVTFFDHGNYVSCVNKDGKVVMYLDSTRVQWRKAEFAPEGAERNASLFFVRIEDPRPTKEKADKKTTAKAKPKVKKPTADDVDAALEDA